MSGQARSVAIPLTVTVAIVGVLGMVVFQTHVADLPGRVERVELRQERSAMNANDVRATVSVDRDGTPLLQGSDELAFALALGFAHARDRLVQMFLTRAIAEGRVSEMFVANDDTRQFDAHIRTLCIRERTQKMLSRLSTRQQRILEAYACGVNRYIETHSLPLELLLAGDSHDLWHAAHSLILLQWFTLSTTALPRAVRVHLPLQLLRAGVSPERLHTLFPLTWPSHTPDMANLTLPEQPASPSLLTGDLWVVSKNKSTSGGALHATTLHHDISTLPSLLYPFRFHHSSDTLSPTSPPTSSSASTRLPPLPCASSASGTSLPGIPLLLSGRTGSVAYSWLPGLRSSFSYCLERVRDSAVLRDGTWLSLGVRVEPLVQKDDPSGAPVNVSIFESNAGIIETQRPVFGSHEALDSDGEYLVRHWSWDSVHQQNLNILGLPIMKDVKDAMGMLRQSPWSAHFVLSDDEGNIGFQESHLESTSSTGEAVRRAQSALPPFAHERLACQRDTSSPGSSGGATRLASLYNPPEGFIVASDTAVYPLPSLSGADVGPSALFDGGLDSQRKSIVEEESSPFAVGSAHYRARYAIERLSRVDAVSLETLQSLHQSTVSLQAVRFIERFRVILTQIGTEDAHRVLAWNGECVRESRAALLFEALYRSLLIDWIANSADNIAQLIQSSFRASAVAELSAELFDNVLLSKKHARSVDESFHRVAQPILNHSATSVVVPSVRFPIDTSNNRSLADRHPLTMDNIFFAQTVPLVLGFSRGPFTLNGCTQSLHSHSSRLNPLHHRSILSPSTPSSLVRVHSAPLCTLLLDHSVALSNIHFIGPSGSSGRRFSSQYDNFLASYFEYYK